MTIPPYEYWPITERPPILWPDGKSMAFYVGLNIEHFVAGLPSTSIFGGTASLSVDPMNHSWRDYSTRVGVWRMIELLDTVGLRASVLLNSDVCREYPQIIAAGVERDWAWLGHGVTNSHLWTGHTAENERALLRTIVRDLTHATGRPPRGWLGPALTETEHTLEILADEGFTYTLDWVVDDQPFPLPLNGRRFISLPYTVEINDITAFLVYGSTPAEFKQAAIDHFDLLLEESERRPGAVFCLALHPFLMNQPSRHAYLVAMLKYFVTHEKVWLATADEIADWYLTQHYDTALAALEATRRPR